MQNLQDLTKFEFLLTLDGNIIIQRYFNVKDFNPAAKNSMELFECAKEICEEISEDLKKISSEYSYNDLTYFFDSSSVEEPGDLKNEHFLLEIKLNDDVFIQRIFPAYVYHPKARYSVDIRPKVRMILGSLTDVLSSTGVTTKYLQYEL